MSASRQDKLILLAELDALGERVERDELSPRQIATLSDFFRSWNADHPTQPKPSGPVSSARPASSGWLAWTDGACSGNPGRGGWAFVLENGEQRLQNHGGSPSTTNNAMEMTAVAECLKALPEGTSLQLHSDSKYVVSGITQWINNWKRRNWKKADGSPVLNLALWREIDRLASKRNVVWKWVKGHDGNPNNEWCDQMAKRSIREPSWSAPKETIPPFSS